MFICNSRIKNLKTKLFFVLIVSNFYSLSMRCEKQESQFQESQSKISQYKVPQQEDGSSCGYHALYNGIMIAKSLKNPSFKAFLDTDIGRGNYFGSSDPINKVSGLFENYDKEFTNTLYSCWLIKSNEIKERNKLGENFAYQSHASYIMQRCKESENVQLVKQCFIYVSETKIGQAVSEGIA